MSKVTGELRFDEDGTPHLRGVDKDAVPLFARQNHVGSSIAAAAVDPPRLPTVRDRRSPTPSPPPPAGRNAVPPRADTPPFEDADEDQSEVNNFATNLSYYV